uniref:HTH CENPB-type domain-containing protein n=1 Tax=Globisporangium ultimum (strain ATCC 200006 / CBS 805.95 / DAOM BR144) TaxID=431595 RepID=K3WDT2_GLOUD
MARGRGAGAGGNLSNEEKLRLCAFAQENPTMNQKELAAWAQRAFDLAKAPCQSTISNTLKKRAALQAMRATELACKRRRVLKHPELDRALGNWVLYCMHKGLKVSGDLIKKQAATFAALLQSPDANDMAFSNGWLTGFQDRHGIRSQRKAVAAAAALTQPVSAAGVTV